MRRRRWLLLPIIMISMVGAMAIGWRMYLDHKVYQLNLRSQARLGKMPGPEHGRKVLIFAPHEDDETLGCGAYMQKAVAAGTDLHLVMMTNGEYPEVDVVFFEETLRPRPAEFIQLGYMRQRETLAALTSLGLKPDAVTFLGYPNQYLNQMWLPDHWLQGDPVTSRRTHASRSPYDNSMTPDAVYCGESMLQDVETALMREQPDTVITLHPNDVHVDHWPTYTVVRFALEELAAKGTDFARRCSVYTYLIHRNQWPAPWGYRPSQDLNPPTALIVDKETDWLSLPVDRPEEEGKRTAIGLYHTQGGKIDPLLRSFIRSNELFGIVPVRNWTDGPTVADTVVIQDAVGDMDTAIANPHGDIRTVTMGLSAGVMTARVKTRGNAAPGTCYHLSIHAGGATPDDRILAAYSWQGNQVGGHMIMDGRLQDIPDGEMKADYDGDEMTLRAPWPLKDGHATFFMVRAWTTRGRHPIDQTATETFRIGERT